MSESYCELKNMSKADLIAAYDRHAKDTGVGLDHYETELLCREQQSTTKIIRNFTIIVTVAAILSLSIEVYRLFY